MTSLAKIGAIAILITICSCGFAIGEKSRGYVTNATGGKPYYHLMYSLKAEDIESLDKLTKEEFYENGGQFEVRIKKDLFPIRAPKCKSHIILRMPWAQGERFLIEKYSLYETISSMYENNIPEKLDVAIELNPYVSFDEDGIYLTQCNVFFRHKGGKYIPNTQP
jgi:hypothetical protein